MNNKGIINLLIIIVMLFVFVTVLIVFYTFFNKIYDPLQGLIEENVGPNSTSSDILGYGRAFFNIFDVGFLVLFLGMGFLVVWGSSSLIAVSKVFIPIFILLFFIVVIVSVGFANYYEDMINSSQEIYEFYINYPILSYILLKLPFFVGVIGLIIMYASYAKLRGQNEFAV